MLMEAFDVSERRACKVAGQHRSTQRRRAKIPHDEPRLVAAMRRLSRRFPRYGYRMITTLLRREGWRVNTKRVERLWRKEGLQVRQNQRKRRRLGNSVNGCTRLAAERRNHVWSYDFVFDRTENGRPLKLLTLVDEYTREALAIHVARTIKADDVLEVLASVMRERGAPEHIRSDNGPEFIARRLRAWLHRCAIGTLFIEPGSPWQNAFVESFNGTLRNELLDGEMFFSVTEARSLVEDWRREYNTVRPHSSLDGMTPAAFGARCAGGGSATLRHRRHSAEATRSTLTMTTPNLS